LYRCNARLAELEGERKDLLAVRQRLLDEYEEKCAELVESLREVERAFDVQRHEREAGDAAHAAEAARWGCTSMQLTHQYSLKASGFNP
jgi:hypothetical protein